MIKQENDIIIKRLVNAEMQNTICYAIIRNEVYNYVRSDYEILAIHQDKQRAIRYIDNCIIKDGNNKFMHYEYQLIELTGIDKDMITKVNEQTKGLKI